MKGTHEQHPPDIEPLVSKQIRIHVWNLEAAISRRFSDMEVVERLVAVEGVMYNTTNASVDLATLLATKEAAEGVRSCANVHYADLKAVEHETVP